MVARLVNSKKISNCVRTLPAITIICLPLYRRGSPLLIAIKSKSPLTVDKVPISYSEGSDVKWIISYLI